MNAGSDAADARASRGAELRSLIDAACDVARAHAAILGPPRQLEDLARRLEEDRFQLAVVGQFKRGKSTLLNALVGRPLLPMAAIPATSVVTRVSAGSERTLSVTLLSGLGEVQAFGDDGGLAVRLSEVVTERGNPGNVLGVAGVHVIAPTPFLSRGVTLVDTPGIGSTHLHNTVAARDALAECDAVLLVFAADLPITEIEEAFAREVRAAVREVIVVMNKVDVASADDRRALEGLLRSRLRDVFMTADVVIWSVSAKAALAARTGDDDVALERSGLPALERHLVDTLVRNRHALLLEAIAAKAARGIAAMRARLEVRRAALALPMEELEGRAALFEAAAKSAEGEGRVCVDLLGADGRRVRDRLSAACDDLYGRARGLLRSELMRIADRSATPRAASEEVRRTMETFFETAKTDLAARLRSDVLDVVAAYRVRMKVAVESVGRSAAEITGVNVLEVWEEPEPPSIREPYWVVSGLPDSLGSLTMDGLAALLPRRLREARARHALRRGLDAAVLRNVSSLQWALQQAVDDGFRTIGTEIDAGVRLLVLNVREAFHAARDAHWSRKAGHDERLGRLASDADRLAGLATAVAAFAHQDDTHAAPSARACDGTRDPEGNLS